MHDLVPLFGIALVGVAVLSCTQIALKLIDRRKSGPSTGELTGIEHRLERIEQAIDAMSVEVERISEGQRFTSKLLADRVALDRPGA
jgi:hypothetical protein